MTKRRDFLKKAGVATVGAVAASTLAAPYVKAQGTIKWRLQTYAGPAAEVSAGTTVTVAISPRCLSIVAFTPRS